MKKSSNESLLEEDNAGYINALPYRLPRNTKNLCHGLAVCRWDLNIESSFRYQVNLNGICG